MNPTDPRLPVDLEAAADLVKATAMTVAERVCLTLSAQSQAASKAVDRNVMFAAQLALYRNAGSFRMQFNTRLDTRMLETLAPRIESKKASGPANWQTLTLVDDKQVEGQMFSDRLGQQIGHSCESELRELAGYMGRITGFGTADPEQNPLRPTIIGQSLYAAIDAVTADAQERQVLAKEFGVVMAQAMPACYAAIVVELQSRGIEPIELQVRTVDGPGHLLPGLNSGYASLRDDTASTRGAATDFQSSARSGPGSTSFPPSLGRGSRSVYGQPEGAGSRADRSASGAASRYGSRRGATGYGHGTGAGEGYELPSADAQLMTLLRRLTQLASRPGELDNLPAAPSGRGGYGAPSSRFGGTEPGARATGASAYGELGSGLPGGSSAGLMAVNLIRAHRDELMQASNGKLDHMVIDVVGSLFDQILSDTRVPPQMARQIARLQLPVLRVALVDPSFFSSRKHPVRRFVNRMASLSCAFDNFEEGLGKDFIDRVRELVQEIVDGDFDQIDLYSFKLAELETFIARQAESGVKGTGAVAVLESKESDLQTQQRYLTHLNGALSAVPMPPFLKSFLCQVWSQALVQASREHGADGDVVKRFRLVGRDLVMSVQPKGSPAMRKRFLMQLPTLMRDLNEGLRLVGWPEPAQKDFFAQLTPAHAASLKTPAMSELDYNLMAKQLESIFNSGIPGQGEMPRADSPAASSLMAAGVEPRFSAEEARRVGLVDERAVDWSRPVDGGLQDEPELPPVPSPSLNLAIDINLDLIESEPAEPTHGAQLIEHMRIGFAYQMLLKDHWQKVRLTYMSPGRSFFVFTHGRDLQETISLTARMLSRMCETERLRSVEANYLMERATSRTRKQLAALSGNSRH